jgi:hypothetical protein
MEGRERESWGGRGERNWAQSRQRERACCQSSRGRGPVGRLLWMSQSSLKTGKAEAPKAGEQMPTAGNWQQVLHAQRDPKLPRAELGRSAVWGALELNALQSGAPRALSCFPDGLQEVHSPA